MPKTYKPTALGTRHLVLPNDEELTRIGQIEGTTSRKTIKPLKSLLQSKRRTHGRNSNGHITCRHRGGGA